MRGMNIKRRILCLFISAGMSASLLTGCNSLTGLTTTFQTPAGTLDSTAELADPVDVSEEDDNTLSIYIWDEDANRATLEAAEYAYKQINPSFKLNIINARTWDKVQGRLSKSGALKDSSSLPDLTMMQDRAAEFMIRTYPEIFQNISDSEVDWSDFPSSKEALTTIDGVHYAYPYDNSTCLAAYRTDILADAGYTIDDLTGITWNRWREIGQDVYDKTGKYLIAMDQSGIDLPFIMMQEEGESCFKDGELDITDNETMKKIMIFMEKATDENCIYNTSNWSNYLDETLSGDKICGTIAGSWIVPSIMSYKDNYGKWAITTLPTFTGAEGYATEGGSSIFLLSSCTGKKKQLAMEFLDYTLGGGFGAQVTYERGLRNSGFLASYLPCGEYPPYRESVGYFEDQKIYLDILDYQNKAQNVEQNKYYYLLRTDLSKEIHLITVKDKYARPTVENALAVVYNQTKFNIRMLDQKVR